MHIKESTTHKTKQTKKTYFYVLLQNKKIKKKNENINSYSIRTDINLSSTGVNKTN